MADGTIRFDTEINNQKMEKALDSILKAFQSFSGNSSKAFQSLDEAADELSETMSKTADSRTAQSFYKHHLRMIGLDPNLLGAAEIPFNKVLYLKMA